MWYLFFSKDVLNFKILPVLRMIFLILLLIGLLQPKITYTEHIKRERELDIFIDNSMSMGFHKGHSITKLNEGIKSLFKKLDNRKIKYSVQHFDKDMSIASQDIPLTVDGVATNIGKLLESAKDENLDKSMGYLLISDGQHTIGVNPNHSLKDISIPIYSLGFGDRSPRVDISIKSIDAPTVAVKNENIEIVGMIESTGNVSERLTVSLYEKNNLIGSKFIRIAGEGSQTNVRFRFHPKQLGESLYTMKISSIEDEMNIENNNQTFSISVLQDQYNVAVLTGVPSYNTGMLKQFIRGMPKVKTDHFVQRGREFYPSLKSFWENKYELIILDNFPVNHIPNSWLSFLKKKIGSQKTSLVWVAGPAINKLHAKSLLSLFKLSEEKWENKENEIGWTLTAEGESLIRSSMDYPNFVLKGMDFPPLYPGLKLSYQNSWMKPVALFNTDIDPPVLLLGETNGVRMAVWTPVNLYALHFNLISSMAENISEFLMSGLFSWLLKTGGNEALHFKINKNNYQQGEEIHVTGIRKSDSSLGAEVFFHVYSTDSLLSSTELRYNPLMEKWEGSLWASVSGKNSYVLEYNDHSGRYEKSGMFFVEESQIELNNVYLNEDLLENISVKTNGDYQLWGQMDTLIANINSDLSFSEELKRFQLFEKKWTVTLLVLLLSLEWGIRRKFGYL
tara:strand:- start:110657 stop:112684 length:2028 start_codon:yes stop_codon:yes gene_type:complete